MGSSLNLGSFLGLLENEASTSCPKHVQDVSAEAPSL